MKSYLVLFCFLISQLAIANVNTTELFEMANSAYNEKKYRTAITHYESILKEGYQSEELYYNLGNSHFKNRTLAKAILAYERCLHLNPHHQEAQNNLRIVKEELEDDIEVLPAFFLADWWQNIHLLLSANIWAFLSILLLWIAAGGIILWLLSANRIRKKQGFLAGIVLFILSLVVLALGGSQAASESDSRAAIIMERSVILRKSAAEESPELMTIHSGTKVALLDVIGTWQKVRLANGELGWIPQNSMEKI